MFVFHKECKGHQEGLVCWRILSHWVPLAVMVVPVPISCWIQSQLLLLLMRLLLLLKIFVNHYVLIYQVVVVDHLIMKRLMLNNVIISLHIFFLSSFFVWLLNKLSTFHGLLSFPA